MCSLKLVARGAVGTRDEEIRGMAVREEGMTSHPFSTRSVCKIEREIYSKA